MSDDERIVAIMEERQRAIDAAQQWGGMSHCDFPPPWATAPAAIYRAAYAPEPQQSDLGAVVRERDYGTLQMWEHTLTRERDYWRAEATTLRALAQKTADQECVYLQQIAALKAQLRADSPNVQPRPVPPHTTASDVKPAPEPKPFPASALKPNTSDPRRIGG